MLKTHNSPRGTVNTSTVSSTKPPEGNRRATSQLHVKGCLLKASCCPAGSVIFRMCWICDAGFVISPRVTAMLEPAEALVSFLSTSEKKPSPLEGRESEREGEKTRERKMNRMNFLHVNHLAVDPFRGIGECCVSLGCSCLDFLRSSNTRALILGIREVNYCKVHKNSQRPAQQDTARPHTTQRTSSRKGHRDSANKIDCSSLTRQSLQ